MLDKRTMVRYNLCNMKVGRTMELNLITKITPKYIKLLSKLGIDQIEQLIEHYPFRYELIKRSNILELENNDKIVIDGEIDSLPSVFYINQKLNKMSFKCNVGNLVVSVVIFNRAFLKNKLNIKTKVTLIGKYDKLKNTITASELRFGLIENDGEMEAVYHATYGLESKKIREFILEGLPFGIDNIIDYLPPILIQKHSFIDKKQAILNIHNPNDLKELKQSILRLKYEELFLFMLRMNYLKINKNKQLGFTRKIDYQLVEQFIDNLPFKLTPDQLKAVDEIYSDLNNQQRMNRLLQGDVGSGKTIVAFISMYMNSLCGYQSALMAPTEVLAHQHYNNFCKLFSKYNLNVTLLTGKLKAKEKKEIYHNLANGKIDIIIGTHALVVDKVEFNNLGLVITDEQHRFGVNQRGSLKNKGLTPDILYMSATPIPRTYALTLYGDMDISSIKTMPSGRKNIITLLKKDKDIKEVLQMMLNELKLNHQIYVIAPLIEESEKIDLENVAAIEEKMNKAFGKIFKVASLHGKIKNDEKEKIMNDFKENKIQILISTTVIEVGIDVPNATMMIIFDSFRFGLSTLHQLRGRVGRSDLQSYCILMSNRETERLKILTSSNDGFEISEEDFRLRGSGDLFGNKQSGDMVFGIADIKRDYKLLIKARDDSYEILKNESYKGTILENIINSINNLD